MKKILYPVTKDWKKLTERPAIDLADLHGTVTHIFEEIRREGDTAVRRYTALFDKIEPGIFGVSSREMDAAEAALPEDLKNAILLAKNNIEKFHISHIEKPAVIETSAGVFCWRENRPIERIGVYIPGGSAPLFSTVLMLGVPANLAGCPEIILCTPPDKNSNINPAILFAAKLIGATAVFKVGGIQAIGAMTFGTESIPKVDKIFGPGNQYVTTAKQQAQQCGVAIDIPAGPSELLVIADKTCRPDFVAADLLSQAEHGADSQVILLSDSETVVEEILLEVRNQLLILPRKDIAGEALQNSKAIVLKSIVECVEFSNEYAPEHLIIATENARKLITVIRNAGSVFVGNFSCESAGDYASGTNHTLPTNGYARSYSGVSVDSFVKKITFQEVTPEGLQNIGPSIELMAEAEQLIAHKNAVTIRLQSFVSNDTTMYTEPVNYSQKL